jgi:hypothetical protein
VSALAFIATNVLIDHQRLLAHALTQLQSYNEPGPSTREMPHRGGPGEIEFVGA